MSDTVLAAILGGTALLNIATLGMLVKLSAQVGRLTGTVKRHDDQLRACPLCPDRSH